MRAVFLCPAVCHPVAPLPPEVTTLSRGWEDWGALIVRHRVTAALAGLVIVGGLALPALSITGPAGCEPSAGCRGVAHPASSVWSLRVLVR
jgi:hypothetical protein